MASKMLHTCLRVENLENQLHFIKMLLDLKNCVAEIFQTMPSRLSI